MPKLVRLYIQQVLIGFAVAAAFVALLMFLNIANLWHLVTHTSGGWLALLMLWIFNGIVFAGVQFALSLPSDRSGRGDGGRRSNPIAQPVAVRVERTPR